MTCAVPPKYAQEDFRDANYWRLRGKLDVPKERFISYPGCESDEDHEPIYGWAGWNHLSGTLWHNFTMTARWRVARDRKDEEQKVAADDQAEDSEEKPDKKPFDDRLVPMLAGLLRLLPWLLQWHNEPSEAINGERPEISSPCSSKANALSGASRTKIFGLGDPKPSGHARRAAKG